jgi:hypothetical protein
MYSIFVVVDKFSKTSPLQPVENELIGGLNWAELN